MRQKKVAAAATYERNFFDIRQQIYFVLSNWMFVSSILSMLEMTTDYVNCVYCIGCTKAKQKQI